MSLLKDRHINPVLLSAFFWTDVSFIPTIHVVRELKCRKSFRNPSVPSGKDLKKPPTGLISLSSWAASFLSLGSLMPQLTLCGNGIFSGESLWACCEFLSAFHLLQYPLPETLYNLWEWRATMWSHLSTSTQITCTWASPFIIRLIRAFWT